MAKITEIKEGLWEVSPEANESLGNCPRFAKAITTPGGSLIFVEAGADGTIIGSVDLSELHNVFGVVRKVHEIVNGVIAKHKKEMAA